MKFIKLFSAAIVAVVLAGCVTLSPEGQHRMCRVIEKALTVPEDRLEKSWFPNDEFAAAIALRYGLNGAPRDEARAAAILEHLTSPQKQMTTRQVKDSKSGKTETFYVPSETYLLSTYEVDVVDDCLDLLSGSAEPSQAALDGGICGGAEYYRHLKELWAARAPH